MVGAARRGEGQAPPGRRSFRPGSLTEGVEAKNGLRYGKAQGRLGKGRAKGHSKGGDTTVTMLCEEVQRLRRELEESKKKGEDKGGEGAAETPPEAQGDLAGVSYDVLARTL